MIGDESLGSALSAYENTLVKQFRTMENLMTISKKERDLILTGSTDSLMKNTEEKEAELDKFSLLEENSRMFLQKIALNLNIQSEQTSIREILPFLNDEDANRVSRLLDGINILVNKARELNLGNQALVMTRMDWLAAAQSFIVSLSQPAACYSMPLMDNFNRNSAVSGLEFRA